VKKVKTAVGLVLCGVAWGLAACAETPVVTAPEGLGPPTCPLEGCGRAASADLLRPAGGVCPLAEGDACGGLGPSACADEALASWASVREGRGIACVTRMLSEACDGGDVRACGFAGRLWLDGKGLEKDVDRGLKLLGLACDGGVALSCLVAARFLGAASGADSSGDDSDAQHRFEMQYACLAGQGEACMQVGLFFKLGDSGFPQDDARAVVAYGRGCNLGDSRACNNLGDAYAYGEGVARDLDHAVDAFDKSCRLGEALGCANLGYRLERGLGIARDVARARSLYRDACNIGASYACLHLDLLAAQGPEASRDPARMLARWKRACDASRDGKACAYEGLIYDDGPDGLARDEVKSIAAMTRGCNLGEPRACDWVRMHSDD
jgi:TPR repeat protein